MLSIRIQNFKKWEDTFHYLIMIKSCFWWMYWNVW